MSNPPYRPVLVGISPAGVKWVAYHPEDIKPLADRLRLVWAIHDQALMGYVDENGTRHPGLRG